MRSSVQSLYSDNTMAAMLFNSKSFIGNIFQAQIILCSIKKNRESLSFIVCQHLLACIFTCILTVFLHALRILKATELKNHV